MTSTVTLNNGSGTTYDAVGARVDLGGTLTKNATITGGAFTFNRLYSNLASFNVYEDASQFTTNYVVSAGTNESTLSHNNDSIKAETISSGVTKRIEISASNSEWVVSDATDSSSMAHSQTGIDFTLSGSSGTDTGVGRIKANQFYYSVSNTSGETGLLSHNPNSFTLQVQAATAAPELLTLFNVAPGLYNLNTIFKNGDDSTIQSNATVDRISQIQQSTSYRNDLIMNRGAGMSLSSLNALGTSTLYYHGSASDKNGIEVYDLSTGGNHTGLFYSDDYSSTQDAGDRWIPDLGTVNSLIGTWIDGSGTTYTDNGDGTKQVDLGGQLDADVLIDNSDFPGSNLYNFEIGSSQVDTPFFKLLPNWTNTVSGNAGSYSSFGLDQGNGGYYIEFFNDNTNTDEANNFCRIFVGETAAGAVTYTYTNNGFNMLGGDYFRLANWSVMDSTRVDQVFTRGMYDALLNSGGNLSSANQGDGITIDVNGKINWGGNTSSDISLDFAGNNLSLGTSGAWNIGASSNFLTLTGLGDFGFVQSSTTSGTFKNGANVGIQWDKFWDRANAKFDSSANAFFLGDLSDTTNNTDVFSGGYASFSTSTWLELGIHSSNQQYHFMSFNPGTGISVGAGVGNPNGVLNYVDDYSANNASNPRWITDKGYVDGGANTLGDMKYFNGSKWIQLPVGTIGQTLTLVDDGSGNPIPQWS